ncbi:MAG: NUDIX domain-containing protein [Thermomicrobiales bacterium]
MGYIRELRAAVGQRTLVLAGTLAVIQDGAGAVLFVRRGDFGNWSLPGGFLEPGQSVLETVARRCGRRRG